MGLFRSPPWTEITLWSLDLETTGLDPGQAEILSIGMVPIRGGAIRWGERHYRLVRPRHRDRLSEESMAVHHILPQEVDSAPALEAVLPDLAPLLAAEALLVHHQALDVAVLKRDFAVQGIRWPRPRIVDTQRLLGRLDHRLRQIRPHAEPLPADLAGARAAFGLPPHEEHHALSDALATAELFLALRARLGLERLGQLT